MDRELSTLEMTALGVVWKKGPCTAYVVMREFAGSQTSAYRSGAGSIYPLLKRLRGAGFLAESDGKLSITDSGLERLRHWAALEDMEASTSLDPLRSRVYFLEVLPVEERRAFVRRGLKSLQDLKKRAKVQVEEYREAGQQMSALAMQGTVYETEARIKFLKEIGEWLGAG